MKVDQIINLFFDMIKDDGAVLNYRDPQEYIQCQNRTSASDMYSYGMLLFKILMEKDYFEYIDTPPDEYFMMNDPQAEHSIVDGGILPDEYRNFSGLLDEMTKFQRENRISYDVFLQKIKELSQPINDNQTVENEADENIFPEVLENYDYGVILNNKRAGRIQFLKLYDYEKGSTGAFDIPVTDDGVFRIAVSRRHKDNYKVTNPSSVYGDCILPTAIIEANIDACEKIRMVFEKISGKIKIQISIFDVMGNKISDIKNENIKISVY